MFSAIWEKLRFRHHFKKSVIALHLMITMIMQESSLSKVCERVLDRCLAPSTAGGEGCDNMTMILVQFKKPINPNSDGAEQSSKPAESVEETEIKEIHVYGE